MGRRKISTAVAYRLRQLPLVVLLDWLQDDHLLFWKRDREFRPLKDRHSLRVLVSSASGPSWELIISGEKWFDTRTRVGGGGAIDLAMYLLKIDFLKAMQLLSERQELPTAGKNSLHPADFRELKK